MKRLGSLQTFCKFFIKFYKNMQTNSNELNHTKMTKKAEIKTFEEIAHLAGNHYKIINSTVSNIVTKPGI